MEVTHLAPNDELPAGWHQPRVIDIAARRANATVGGPFGSDLVAKDYVDSGVPVIRGQNMGKRYVAGEFAFVAPAKAKALQSNLARPSDLVFTQRGTLGQIAQVPSGPYEEYLISQSQMKLTLDSGAADPGYVRQYFASALGQKQILDSAIQTGVPHTNLGILRNYVVPMPRQVDEQEAIAAALTDADTLIDSLEQLLTKKRQIKQGAMQELLTGKQRLPGFQQSWSEVRLGEVGRTYGGLTGKGKADFGHGASKYITFMNVMTTVRTSTEMVESVEVGPSESQNMVQTGDLLFNGSSETPEEVALCSWVETCDEGVFLNSFCFGFRPFVADRLSGLFMAYFFRGRLGRAAVSSLAQGATRYNIAKTALLQAPLCLPTFAEQQAIAEVLSSMDTEVAALESRLTKARALKQAMAQALLTGRIRIPLAPLEPAVPVPPPKGVGALGSGPART